MADIAKTVEIIFSGQDKTSAAVASVSSSINGLGNNANQATGQIQQTNEELEKVGEKKDGIDKAANALKSLAASLVVKDFLDANIALEQFRNTLTIVTGSSTAAQTEFDFIRTAANRLGVEVRDAAAAYAQFAAAAKGTAAEGQGARIVFEGFVGAFASLGASGADVAGAFTQLAQGVSKGKFELEDLKSIAVRLPGFFGKFATALGVTNEELFDLISKGQIGVPEIIKLGTALKENIGDQKFDSFNNELARLKNGINDVYIAIGDAGAFQLLKKVVEGAAIPVVGAVAAFTLLADVIKIVTEGLDVPAVSKAFTSGGLVGLFTELSRQSDSVQANAGSFGEKIDAAVNRAATSVEGLIPRFLGLNQATDEATKETNKFQDAIDEETKALNLIYPATDKAAESKDKLKTKTTDLGKELLAERKFLLESEKAANDYAAKLEDIASNERIKFIEARVKLDIAEAQANAQIITATFGSLGDTFKSTGDVISSVFGAISNIGGFYGLDQLELIEGQLEKENEYRTEALKLQQDLTQATIRNLDAKTQQISSGGALINVDGAGLQPHLEAFMWEILKTIQIRVNQDGLEMLVGV